MSHSLAELGKRFRALQAASAFAILSTVVLLGSATILGTAGCAETATEPEPPPPEPACQRFNTADVSFENRSGRSTYDVILDGAGIGSIGPGRSITQTVAAGVEHSVLFRFANTAAPACTEARPVWIRCTSNTLSCSADL